jgi:chromosome partitioning protein
MDTRSCIHSKSALVAIHAVASREVVMNEKNLRKTHVVMVANQKGGVAKTTTTLNLASALAERSKKVLVIDLDATGGATKALGAPMTGWHSSYDLITSSAPPMECAIQSGDEEVKLPPGIDLVPSSKELVELDEWMRRRENKWRIHQDLLLEPITKLRGLYDYIFFDTPPQVTSTTLPAMKASDFVILSCMPEKASTDALADALEDIRTCQAGPNPKLALLGIVVSAMPNPVTVLARQLNDYIARAAVDSNGNSYRFNTHITRSKSVQEARAMLTTVLQYDGGGKIADQYRELAKEVIQRVEAATGLPKADELPPPEASGDGAQSMVVGG